MDHLLDDDDDDRRRDRELTLSTGSILGLFFGLVLLCGVFFGLGYNLGSHKAVSTSTAAVASTAAPESAAGPDFSSFKPSAGSPTGAAKPAALKSAVPLEQPASSSSTSSAERDNAEAAPSVRASNRTSAPPNPLPPRSDAATLPSHTSAALPGGSFMVQIAAVSHQEDADLLIGALKSRGYHVLRAASRRTNSSTSRSAPSATTRTPRPCASGCWPMAITRL